MDHRIINALHARDTQVLLQLCGEVNSNLTLTAGGYEATLAHHIALTAEGPDGLQCIRKLIKQFGLACLTVRDACDNTVVHLAAHKQDDTWMKLIHHQLGSSCFEYVGQHQRNAVHFAAVNTRSNSAVKWLVGLLGPGCLLMKDCNGDTPIHLAAFMQGLDTMKFIWKRVFVKDKVFKDKASFFWMEGFRKRTVMHFAAMNERGTANMWWLVGKCESDHLLLKDDDGNTSIHLAAQTQDSNCLKDIRDKLKNDELFLIPGQYGNTVVHFAAMNARNSALLWCIGTLGSKCLTTENRNNVTPAHLAARYQGLDSLRIITNSLGCSVFEMRDIEGKTVRQYAENNKEKENLMEWIKKQLPLPSEHFELPPKQPSAPPVWSVELGSIQPEPGPIQPESAPIQPESAPIRPESAPIQPESAPIQPESAPIQPESTPIQPESAPIQPESAPIQSESAPIQPESGPIQPESGPILPVSASILSVSGQKQFGQIKPIHVERQKPLAPKPLAPVISRSPSFPARGSYQAMRPKRPASLDYPEFPEPSTPDPNFTTWKIVEEHGVKVRIGSGQFSKIYVASTDRQQTIAVKIVRVPSSKDLRDRQKAFDQERQGVEILKSIRHRNILLFLKSESTDDGQFCVFTELISGYNLHQIMHHRNNPFGETELKDYSQQICIALNYLHCYNPAVLHRDIKCSNIMLTNQGVIKLIDFGLAKEIVSGTVAHITFNPSGTWHFMAPELFNEDGKLVYTPKTDVWAFGCALFEMLHMHPPNEKVALYNIPNVIRKRKLPDLPPEVSTNLSDFYRRCVAMKPEDRADISELLQHCFLCDDVPASLVRSIALDRFGGTQ